MAQVQFTNTGDDIFTGMISSAAQDLMSQQLASNQPQPTDGLVVTSNPLLPDRLVSDRIGNMDQTIYDLSDASHIIKLLKVLLGAPGAGGLRKQIAVARLANSFNGMHFLDLDRFWGALFGIQRTQAEMAPNFSFDPYVGATTQPQWDDLHSRDAGYRDRLIKFARSVYYGASLTGIKAMVESLIQEQCEIYEGWQTIDEQNAFIGVVPVQVYTYGFLQSTIKNYGQMQGSTWGDWGGGGSVNSSRTGIPNRAEVQIVPKRTLSQDEVYQVLRVVNTFKPAGINISIQQQGINIRIDTAIRDVYASSEYWDVQTELVNQDNLAINPAALMIDARYSQSFPQGGPVARPAFSGYQGEIWSYAADVSSVDSYTIVNGSRASNNDDETVIFTDNTAKTYKAPDSVLTAARANGARIVSDGTLTSGAYAPARSVATT